MPGGTGSTAGEISAGRISLLRAVTAAGRADHDGGDQQDRGPGDGRHRRNTRGSRSSSSRVREVGSDRTITTNAAAGGAGRQARGDAGDSDRHGPSAAGSPDTIRGLEVGTGTGYNSALLSRRLGTENVVSIDLDPALVDLARTRLAALGHRPALATGDGALGLAGVKPARRPPRTARAQPAGGSSPSPATSSGCAAIENPLRYSGAFATHIDYDDARLPDTRRSSRNSCTNPTSASYSS